MYIGFDDMPESARVWWYQAERALRAEEIERVESTLKEKVGTWMTHGMPLKGSFRVFNERIIVIAADVEYQMPSGCSVDSSTRWLQELGGSLGISLFDRSFGILQGEELHFVPFTDLKLGVERGTIGPETAVVNSQVASKGDLDSKFFIPAKETYIKRYFSAVERA